MRIYLDDDSTAKLLERLLIKAGHDVIVPASVGLDGEADPVHLAYAANDGRVLRSGNHDDFEDLHHLILTVGGHYPGILMVRRDNDPRKDLLPPGVVRAIRNLLAAGASVEDSFVILNQWR